MRVSFAPLASLLADTRTPSPSASEGGKDPYLWLAGFAFALLALASLSLCFLSGRQFQVRTQ